VTLAAAIVRDHPSGRPIGANPKLEPWRNDDTAGGGGGGSSSAVVLQARQALHDGSLDTSKVTAVLKQRRRPRQRGQCGHQER